MMRASQSAHALRDLQTLVSQTAVALV